eukprot:TRINITY_DN65233_c0_g1_i1.p1 TRINITY_DN65233_c0_g1~~TRINITY_DN65233_c0_g1_i1.p1  ORF type:complete len:553 (+),score=81.72 TRINITY_DN65233_c0_g1_i1:96-1661(+)
MTAQTSLHDHAKKLMKKNESTKKSEEDMLNWSVLRKQAFKLIRSQWFDFGVTMVLLSNIVFVIIDTNFSRKGESPFWMRAMDLTYLSFYVLELTVRLFVDRCAYFSSALNVFDTLLVTSDFLMQVVVYSSMAVPPLSVLRVFKILRLLRIVRTLDSFRELWIMLHGLIAAMKALVWAVALIAFVFIFWSILSTTLLDDVTQTLSDQGKFSASCGRCSTAFETVETSMLTWFILIFVGDLWTDLVAPIVNEHPAAALLFFPSFFIIHFSVLNLVLAVIVDRAAEAREENLQMVHEWKLKQAGEASNKLRGVCEAMDKDRSGTLTFEELVQGYEELEEFRHNLSSMDVCREDLSTVFCILDEDNSGSVAYDEFVKQLYKMKTEESHTLLVFLKHHVQVLVEKVNAQVDLLRTVVIQTSTRQEEEIASIHESFCRMNLAYDYDSRDSSLRNLSRDCERLSVDVTSRKPSVDDRMCGADSRIASRQPSVDVRIINTDRSKVRIDGRLSGTSSRRRASGDVHFLDV